MLFPLLASVLIFQSPWLETELDDFTGTTFLLFEAVKLSAGIFQSVNDVIHLHMGPTKKRSSDVDWTFPAPLNAAIHSPCHDLSSHSISLAEVIPQVILRVRAVQTTGWVLMGPGHMGGSPGGSNSSEWARSLPKMGLTDSLIENTHFYSFWEKVFHMAHFLYVLDVPEEKVKHQVYPLQQDSQAMKEAKFMPRGFKIRYLRTFFFFVCFYSSGHNLVFFCSNNCVLIHVSD